MTRAIRWLTCRACPRPIAPSIAASPPSPTDPVTHYVIVRQDLPPGQQLAQSVHAAGESGPAVSGTYAVVLSAQDEPKLLDLHARLSYFRVPHVLVREPDPPYLGAAMAIGFPPQPRSLLRKFTKGLKKAC